MPLTASSAALLIIISTEVLIGILANAFILGVNGLDWLKAQRLTSADLLLVTLGISNILFECTVTVNTHLIPMQEENLRSKDIRPFLRMLSSCATFSCSWLTACLCVFYCLKIVHSNHALFNWFKSRSSRMVPWTLLASVCGSVTLSIPMYWNNYRSGLHNATSNLTSNSTMDEGDLRWALSYTIATNVLGCSLPLVLVALSVTFILFSLCRHTWKMKQNLPNNGGPHLEAHIRAANTMSGLLILHAISYLSQVSSFFMPWQEGTFWSLFCWVVIASCSPAQSVLLILGNSKLRKTFLRVMGSPRTEDA
ncbi:taste receptor type 2 member 41-like [Ambystoma mexicanum]|uniref:taste receptor type 2 member 41-like n=1 Tax=Ambystoma mexicanum TaxID=8296 RepID=UPI0037E920A6